VPRGDWAEAIYPAAELFVERSLRDGVSFVTGGESVWIPEAADDFYDRFVVKEDLSTASFTQKLVGQLTGAREEVVLLAADLVCICTLPVHDIGPDAKLKRLRGVLGLLSPEPEIHARVLDAFSTGIASYGAGRTAVWKHMQYTAEFARAWIALDEQDRARLLEDAWAWKEFLAGVPGGNGAQAAALLHMVYPDVFEPIVSVDAKAAIGKTFARVAGVAEEPDADRKLQLIRSALEPVIGSAFQYWDDSVQPVWQRAPSDRAWTFAEFARKFRELPSFEEQEVDYKLELAMRLAKARDAVLANHADWLDKLRDAFAPPNNITGWRQHDAFLKWCESKPDEARHALASLWSATSANTAKLDPFLAVVPGDVIDSPGGRANIVSYLFGAWRPEEWVNYKPTASDRALKICGFDPAETHDVAERIARFRAFIDQLRIRVVAIGGPATSRLEAQGMSWFVVREETPEEWSDAEREGLAAFRAWPDGRQPPQPPPLVEPSLLLAPVTPEVAKRVFFDVEPLQEIVDLLAQKRQLVFFGPPGTGKTLVAQVIAEHLTGAGGEWQLVQFHPSYAYEDFMEGYRPEVSTEGTLSYELRQGPLRRIVEDARSDPGNPYVLIVDEINRGNIPKIFGELLFLLEYRDRPIALQYSQEPFSLPPNVYVIGTMNTADRSIALVDAALRRRFFFVPFLPSEEPVKSVLRRWLEDQERDDRSARLVEVLNEKIAKDEISIGPSYLMTGDGSDSSLRRIWRYSIMPLLEEHYYGTKHAVEKEFGLDACLKAIDGATPDGAAEEAPDELAGSGGPAPA